MLVLDVFGKQISDYSHLQIISVLRLDLTCRDRKPEGPDPALFVKRSQLQQNWEIGFLYPGGAGRNGELKSDEFPVIQGKFSCPQWVEHRLAPLIFPGGHDYVLDL